MMKVQQSPLFFCLVALLAGRSLSFGVVGFVLTPSSKSSSLLLSTSRSNGRVQQASSPLTFSSNPTLPKTFHHRKSNKQCFVLFSQSQEESEEGPALATPLDNPALTALDIVALTGFAAVGKASHAPDGSIDLGAVLVTAFPFIAAWLAASPLTGVYKELESKSSTSDVVKNALLQTVKGWAVAVPLGCALRGIIKGYVPPAPFVIVTLIATLVILSTVRVVYALATTEQQE